MPRKVEVEGLRSRARAAAAEFGDAAREQAEDAFEAVVEAAEEGADVTHRYLRKQFKERPIAVAATALSVGLLLGMLISGRR
jgi:ElaB/YqjD/DUF883 family membrane-anchored ribosome-binding protein